MPNPVQQRMEDMIPELDAYHKQDIFSEDEIFQIVENRQRLENRLNRRISKLEDYLRLAKYELGLEHTRRSRMAEKKIQSPYLRPTPPTKRKRKNISCDYAITRRIHSIFRAALRKHYGDISLWLTYFDVATFLGSKKVVSQIYGTALQKHPTQVGFWIMAASFEANECHTPMSARVIFQRGIRVNPDSLALWLEFFRFEAIFAVLRRLSESTTSGDENLSSIANGALALAVFDSKKSVSKPAFVQACLEIYRKILCQFSDMSLPLLEAAFSEQSK